MIKIIQDQKKKSPWPRTSWALKSKTKLYKSVIPRISLTFSCTVLSFWLVFIQSNRVYFPRKLFSERTSNADYTRVTWRFWTLCLISWYSILHHSVQKLSTSLNCYWPFSLFVHLTYWELGEFKFFYILICNTDITYFFSQFVFFV